MNTKLLAALIVVGVLAIAVVGLVAAQVATTTPSPNGTNGATANGGFFGWIGRCFGLRGASYYGSQAATNQSQPVTITVTNPNTNTTTTYQVPPGYGTGTNTNTGTTSTDQGYYGYSGCGGMMSRFFP